MAKVPLNGQSAWETNQLRILEDTSHLEHQPRPTLTLPSDPSYHLYTTLRYKTAPQTRHNGLRLDQQPADFKSGLPAPKLGITLKIGANRWRWVGRTVTGTASWNIITFAAYDQTRHDQLLYQVLQPTKAAKKAFGW